MQWTPSTMGRKGGKKSRRTLTAEQARAMVVIREKKRLGLLNKRKKCPLSTELSDVCTRGRKKKVAS